MPEAVRLSDFHETPMSPPTAIPVPAAGENIVGPSTLPVFTEKLPVTKLGAIADCVPPTPAEMAQAESVKVTISPGGQLEFQPPSGTSTN